jgi:hypothetical protein
MSTMTLYAPPTPSKRAKAEKAHKGWFARFCQRLYDARMKRAQDVFQQHVHLLPADLQRAALQLSARNEHTLPFVR